MHHVLVQKLKRKMPLRSASSPGTSPAPRCISSLKEEGTAPQHGSPLHREPTKNEKRLDDLEMERTAVLTAPPPLESAEAHLHFVVVHCTEERVLVAPRVDHGSHGTVPGFIADGSGTYGFALGWSELWPSVMFEGHPCAEQKTGNARPPQCISCM